MEYSKSAKASTKITSLLFKSTVVEYRQRLEELKDPRIIYVTDLVSCSHKRELRKTFLELYFRFEPAMILGELLHRGLEEMLEEEGFKREQEFQLPIVLDISPTSTKEQEFIIKGRVDAIKDKTIVEIKTARGIRGIPHPHHLLQLQIYLNLLGGETGILIYVTPSKILEFEVPREEVDVKSLAEETVLDMRHPRWSWECNLCPFSKICPYSLEIMKSSE